MSAPISKNFSLNGPSFPGFTPAMNPRPLSCAAVRTEWSQKTQFDAAIVDQFLRWANGLPLKVERLFVPVYFAAPRTSPTAKALIKSAAAINAVRNAVVHQGSFSNTGEAEAIIAEAKAFINMIVGLSIDGFDIDDEACAAEARAPSKVVVE